MTAIRVDQILAVERQFRVRIDGHQDDAAVRVDGVTVTEPHLQIVQHVRLVEVGEGREVALSDEAARVAQRRQSGFIFDLDDNFLAAVTSRV